MQSSMFKCAYSLETISWRSSNKLTIAMPMISFCNLALCDLTEYLGKYGDYTIGMRKSWKYANLLSPVWYRSRNALSLQPLMDLYKQNIQIFSNAKQVPTTQDININDINELIWSQISYTKNFEGPLKRRNIKCYRFLDEHEFRYVPSLGKLKENNIIPVKSEKQYEEYKKISKNLCVINNESIGLSFTLEDIEFILVKDKGRISYVNKFVQELSKIQDGTRRNPFIFTYDEVKRNIIGIDHHKEL